MNVNNILAKLRTLNLNQSILYAVTLPLVLFLSSGRAGPLASGGPSCTAHPAQALLRAWCAWHCQMQLPFDSFGFIHSFNCLLHCQFGIVVVPLLTIYLSACQPPFPSPFHPPHPLFLSPNQLLFFFYSYAPNLLTAISI